MIVTRIMMCAALGSALATPRATFTATLIVFALVASFFSKPNEHREGDAP